MAMTFRPGRSNRESTTTDSNVAPSLEDAALAQVSKTASVARRQRRISTPLMKTAAPSSTLARARYVGHGNRNLFLGKTEQDSFEHVGREARLVAFPRRVSFCEVSDK